VLNLRSSLLSPTSVSALGIGLSATLFAVLAVQAWATSSELGFSQAADSFVDVGTASVLLWAIRIAQAPADEEHPHGHRPAEPIAALFVAMLAGVTGASVVRSAIEAIWSGPHSTLTWMLALAFAAKIAAKTGLVYLCSQAQRREPSPALAAMATDARNDILTSFVALAGFFSARWGAPAIDAWLALPLGGWIVWSGFNLARENIVFLMGSSAPQPRIAELKQVILAVDGVSSVPSLIARHHGSVYEVNVHVIPDPELSLTSLAELRDLIVRRVLAQSDIGRVEVHIELPLPPHADDEAS
jgi:cation diffusion facilitator family transporter